MTAHAQNRFCECDLDGPSVKLGRFGNLSCGPRRSLFFQVDDELLHFLARLFGFRLILFAKAIEYLQLLPRAFLLTLACVRLCEVIMGRSQIRLERNRALKLLDGIAVPALVREQNS